ncbi:MAG: hypothetical protein JNL62_03415 [Bryobacterales bacterium]|nr:hypothetical protein [Bryobacterales bacterium]
MNRRRFVYEYLLLGRDAPEGEPLHHIQGKRIAIASRTGACMGAARLDTLMPSERFGPPARFFQSIALVPKPSACVPPVFFVATRKELNPQPGRLKVLARTQPMLEGMMGFASTPHPYREEPIQALLELHKDPAGAQMVMVFHTGPLVRAAASDIEASRATWEESRSLGSGTARAALAAAAGGGGVR